MVGFFKRLFGGGAAPEDTSARPPDLEYKGVEVRAAPVKEPDGQWRLAGTLTRMVDGVPVTRRFLRADLMASKDQACASAIDKARMIIDHNGDALWRGDMDRPV